MAQNIHNIQIKQESGKRRRTISIGSTFFIIVLIFFLIGLTNNITNSLNVSVARYYDVENTVTSLLQIIFSCSYAIAIVPIYLVTRRYGYRGGLIVGLTLFIVGCFISMSSTVATNSSAGLGFTLFLAAIFYNTLGIAMLDASDLPYITKLGPEKGSAKRVSFANSFTGLGSMLGPFILASLMAGFLNATPDNASEAVLLEEKMSYLGVVRIIYLGLAIIAGILFLVLLLVNLPKLPSDKDKTEHTPYFVALKQLFRMPHFTWGFIAGFFGTGIMASMATITGWVTTEAAEAHVGISATIVGVAAIVSTVGRFCGVPVLAKKPPHKVLGVYMIIAASLFALAHFLMIVQQGFLSFIAFIATFFFMSIAFVTIFSLAIAGCNEDLAKAAGSIFLLPVLANGFFTLVLISIGGEIGYIKSTLFYVPFLLFIAWYGFKGCKLKGKDEAIK